jgi:hypothetical protein
MVDHLDWDDEGPTRETLRPPSSAMLPARLPPRARPSKPRNLVLVRRAMEAPAFDDAPPTERDPEPSGRPTLESVAPASSIREAAPAPSWEPLPPSVPLPLTDDFDHRETHRLPVRAARAAADAAVLEREVARLRRWILTTSALAVAAVVFAGALLLLVLARPSSLGALGHAEIELPAARVPSAAPVAVQPETVPAAPKIRLTVAFAGPSASVLLGKAGRHPEQLPGPWPRVLELEPGTYVLMAMRSGRAAFVRTLDLTPDRPQREVVIHLAGK